MLRRRMLIMLAVVLLILLALGGYKAFSIYQQLQMFTAPKPPITVAAALAEQRRAVASVLMLEFDHPALILADGCPLVAASQGRSVPMRMLEPYEVLTLMALLGRASQRRVA